MVAFIDQLITEIKVQAEKDSREGYQDAIQDVLNLIESKVMGYVENVKLQNSNLVENFLAEKKLNGCSAGTIKNYRIELNKFKESIDKNVDEITDIDIKHYLSEFANLKKSTLSTKISVLKSFFSYLFDEELIKKNPMQKIKRMKEEKNQPKYLSMDEMLRLREGCGQDIRLRSLLELMFESGCRISEVCDIKKQDIDWETNSIIVKGKGSKERVVFFHTNTKHFLKRYLESRYDDCPFLFVTKKGIPRKVNPRSIQMEMKKLGIKSQISQGIHPHMLRHTFATYLLNKGMDISIVAELLGHEKLSTTQIYAKVTIQRKSAEYQRHIA
ncbi:site-specific tyrosine recombinase/integron integrase [Aneurinibacillus terranovensis]|uniref:site-specific tyrosine recombinase/integron integrase n=1 Tax=Aneurinibacillus terranovensis TaxID=278991 RepID=UPI0004053CAB|nr:site-specific tyrosine recombinase/integron integrase [Aneurinibacillus terranovensis]